MNIQKAACGLDCRQCNLYNAGNDRKAAEALVTWFRSRGWIGENDGAEAIQSKAPICQGCRSGGILFCGSCHLRKCCDEKSLQDCGDCDSFPCFQYKEWAAGIEHHENAMNELLKRRQKTERG